MMKIREKYYSRSGRGGPGFLVVVGGKDAAVVAADELTAVSATTLTEYVLTRSPAVRSGAFSVHCLRPAAALGFFELVGDFLGDASAGGYV